jgi:hypothetical protein
MPLRNTVDMRHDLNVKRIGGDGDVGEKNENKLNHRQSEDEGNIQFEKK